MSRKSYLILENGKVFEGKGFGAEKDAVAVGEILRNNIIAAGEYYKLRCPLDGEYKIGGNWLETH